MFIPTSKKKWETKVKKGIRKKRKKTSSINPYIINIKQKLWKRKSWFHKIWILISLNTRTFYVGCKNILNTFEKNGFHCFVLSFWKLAKFVNKCSWWQINSEYTLFNFEKKRILSYLYKSWYFIYVQNCTYNYTCTRNYVCVITYRMTRKYT